MCEQLDVEYSIGIGMNNARNKHSEELLQNTVEQHEKTGEPQRLFTSFAYQAGTWIGVTPLSISAAKVGGMFRKKKAAKEQQISRRIVEMVMADG